MSIIDNRDMLGVKGSELSEAGARDYFELLKPRVMSLVVFTAFAGLVLAPGEINPVLGIIAILCIAVGAGASGALNMWYDADIDAVMSRTARRPIPSGRIAPREALAFGLTLSAFSVVILGLAVNWFSAGLLAFTIFFYAVIYTMWLKRSTPQNIVIGGAAGAFPPMLGWACVTGGVSLDSIILFLIILDTGAFLGAGAFQDARLRRRRYSDDAECGGRAFHQEPDDRLCGADRGRCRRALFHWPCERRLRYFRRRAERDLHLLFDRRPAHA